MSRTQGKRLRALESGPGGAQSPQAWARRYGWSQLYGWDALQGRRIRAKLMMAIGQEHEAIPEETPLERAYHDAMARAYPVSGEELARLKRKLCEVHR